MKLSSHYDCRYNLVIISHMTSSWGVKFESHPQVKRKKNQVIAGSPIGDEKGQP